MILYFVRHGETDWNKERRVQGQIDIPMNEFGRHLARETAKGLKDIPLDVCFTSPLGRAKETAEIILKGRNVPVYEDWRIAEIALGGYEGKCCSKSNWELPEEFRKFHDAPEQFVAASGGEDFFEVKERTGAFLRELCKRKEYKDSSVLISTHGAALAGLLNNLRNEGVEKFWGIGVHKNCAVTKAVVTGEDVKIEWENRVFYKDQVESWDESY